MSLLTNLISYWALDEASGTRVDVHGGHDLTDNNTVGVGTGLVYGSAADFDAASNEWLSVTDHADLSVGDIDFTVAAWVKLADKSTNRDICGKGDGDDQEYSLQYIAASDRFKWTVYTATGFSSPTAILADSIGSPSTGVWYLVFGWHDASENEVTIRVNTVDNAAAHTTGCYDSNASFTVGIANTNFPGYMDGLIGPVMFWKRILTLDELLEVYNGGAGLTYAAFSGAVAGYLLVAN